MNTHLVQVKIPPALRQKLESFATEVAGNNRNELMFPDWLLMLEAREAIHGGMDHKTQRAWGPIYIDLTQDILMQAVREK